MALRMCVCMFVSESDSLVQLLVWGKIRPVSYLGLAVAPADSAAACRRNIVSLY